MVDSIPVKSEEHFVEMCSGIEENSLNNSQLKELYAVWEDYVAENGESVLVLVPEWFSENEFNSGRRPYFFATVEHDDPSSGAILFSNAQLVNISVVENQVLADVSLDQSIEQLDISANDDYIDEPGKVWVPRSLMGVFEQAG